MRYHSTNTTVDLAKYYLVWCPTYRRRVLVGGAPLAVVRRHVEDQRVAAGR